MDDGHDDDRNAAGDAGLGRQVVATPDLARPQPWTPAQATEIIRHIARGDYLFHLTGHADDQMEERGLCTGDALHVLKHGFVLTPAQPSTQDAFYKYRMDSKTPNSNNRMVRVIVIPGTVKRLGLKLVTVMWKDEDTFKG